MSGARLPIEAEGGSIRSVVAGPDPDSGFSLLENAGLVRFGMLTCRTLIVGLFLLPACASAPAVPLGPPVELSASPSAGEIERALLGEWNCPEKADSFQAARLAA